MFLLVVTGEKITGEQNRVLAIEAAQDVFFLSERPFINSISQIDLCNGNVLRILILNIIYSSFGFKRSTA
jgi:hypothetical protein